MIYLLLAFGAAAAAYQLLALAAGLRQALRRPTPGAFRPPVSILKPLHGLDPDFYQTVRSHALLDYPEFELLFGVSDAGDPAIGEIERLQAEFPAVAIRLIRSDADTPNRKVGVMADLAAAARYPVFVVNDSDIRVEPDYLQRVVAPLADPNVGMVTCLYRARARLLPGRFEAVGIATDFAPSVLVAPLVGVSGFALGSTMAFRADDLARIGGFASFAGYIADDHELGRRIGELGRRVVISTCVVETTVPDASWVEMWRHQVRWARTIRLSRGGGYLGLPIANATLWAVLLAAGGLWKAALALVALRVAAGLMTAVGVLRDRQSLACAYLIPFRDLAGLAIWAAGLFGSTVVWRDASLKLDREGRIVTPKVEISSQTR
ncbi:MAG TPA: bacteriohopanetetrol glucosamine biosynthesis glycosyltransferase HpnI [Bryobacteraceae bacterium]|nr:bacteriohopanetetrol glucosamine biosynthesis glycosyltransferase HpnI [Bryobacteraceae bacterium]